MSLSLALFFSPGGFRLKYLGIVEEKRKEIKVIKGRIYLGGC
jgi:hypothetical protein